tara:strand:+ start:355 stop:732 length:378 start_codon:yes stop_codon:yes gene_type:complete
MKMIIYYIFLVFPSFCFASFPVSTNSYSDTIPETKKETLEEYRQRIQKQLYLNDDDLYKKYISEQKSRKKSVKKENLSKWGKIHPLLRFLIIISGLFLIGIIIVIILMSNASFSSGFDIDDFSND